MFWRNVVNINGQKKDMVCLLNTLKLWSKTLGHAIDLSIYKRKKHMEHVAEVNMTVQLGRTFENIMDDNNLSGYVFKNKCEMKRDKARDDTKEASAATQTYEDRLRLAKVDVVLAHVDLPHFTMLVNTFTVRVWTYHGED